MNKDAPLYAVRPIRDLRDMLQQSTELYADKPVFLIKDNHAARVPEDDERVARREYLPVTYAQFDRDVHHFGTWLMRHGVNPTKGRLAILAETRYEWYVSYLATTNGYGVVVPLDKELPDHELASLLNRASCDTLIYSSKKQTSVDAIRSQVPTLKQFISMEAEPEVAGDLSFWSCLSDGKDLYAAGERSFDEVPIDPHEMRILLFTSGTTALQSRHAQPP